MLGNIEKTLRQAGFTEISMENDAPFLREKGRKAEFLTALSNEILGAEDEPYVMSGGTYARRVPGAVAYGFGNCHIAEPVPFPAGHGGAHQPDEAVHPDKLRKGMMIYVMPAEWRIICVENWKRTGGKRRLFIRYIPGAFRTVTGTVSGISRG